MKNNTYEEETFNVTRKSIGRISGLCKLTLVLQCGPEIEKVNLCLCGLMGNSFQMNLWNLQNKRHQWRRILYVTKKNHPHHPPPPLPLTTTTISIVPTTIFSTCWKYTLKAGIKSDDDCFADNKGEEMNLTPTLLIKIVTAVTVTMKCTPEYPKHRALNSLHDMAYYK